MTGRLPDPAWNPAPKPYRRGDTVVDLFRWCVRRWPDTVALRDGDRTLTYRQLDRLSDAHAVELAADGVGHGDRVALVMPRGLELVVALLGVLKRGAAYSALDPRWPEERRSLLIERLASPVVVTEVDLDRLAAVDKPHEPVPIRPGDAFAVFFTSGSSGTPKGVVSPHEGVVRLFDDWAFAPHGSGVVMPQTLPAAWDGFGLDCWAVLLGGGTVVVVAEAVELTRSLRRLVADGVTTLWIPTAMFHLIVDTDLDAFSGLRRVGTGGERLSVARAREFLARHPDIPLHNMYGPVECTIVATEHLVTPADCVEPPGVPLGRPYDNTEVHVLDGDRVCAVGEVGEICLGGAGLAIGYLGDPELTARKFVHVDLPGGRRRLYRTGDLGHLSPAGALHFDGRADRQIKIRSHRIELDEIERAADAVDGVATSVVVPLRGPDESYVDMCLCYTCVPDAEVDEATLRQRLAARMPAYMVPGIVHRLAEMPLLPSRKIDRKRLEELASSLRDHAEPGEQAVDAVERRVAGVFCQVLGVASVPRDRSFFDLGGNSLSAAQLCTRLERDFGVDVTIAAVFESATVEGVAALLS